MLFTVEGPGKQRDRERERKREREIERERYRSGVRKEEKIVEETFILPDRNHVLASNQEVKVQFRVYFDVAVKTSVTKLGFFGV